MESRQKELEEATNKVRTKNKIFSQMLVLHKVVVEVLYFTGQPEHKENANGSLTVYMVSEQPSVHKCGQNKGQRPQQRLFKVHGERRYVHCNSLLFSADLQ